MEQHKHSNKDPFDQLLTDALQKHSEPVRRGFTEKVLHKIDHFEEQKLLNRVVLEARIVLGLCVVFAVSSLTAILLYAKDIANVLTRFSSAAANASFSIKPDWELVLIVAVGIGSVIYASYDSLGLKRLLTHKLFG